jgi:hypothetical protein
LGIVIIELLISTTVQADKRDACPFYARQMVDGEDTIDLSNAIHAVAMTGGGWDGAGNGRQAAKILADVAVDLTGKTLSRQTPVMVLEQIERAYKLVESQ